MRQVFTHSSWSPSAAAPTSGWSSSETASQPVGHHRALPPLSSVLGGPPARLRAYVVSRETCAKVARTLGSASCCGRYASESHENGELDQLAGNANVLADLTEALIGAVYLTFGLDTVRPAVIEVFTEHIRFARRATSTTRPSSRNCWRARRARWRTGGRESGPAHDRRFEVEAVVDGDTLGRGTGASKKRAEQQAAAEALAGLQERTERAARPRMRLFGRRKSPEDET